MSDWLIRGETDYRISGDTIVAPRFPSSRATVQPA